MSAIKVIFKITQMQLSLGSLSQNDSKHINPMRYQFHISHQMVASKATQIVLLDLVGFISGHIFYSSVTYLVSFYETWSMYLKLECVMSSFGTWCLQFLARRSSHNLHFIFYTTPYALPAVKSAVPILPIPSSFNSIRSISHTRSSP